MIKLITLLLTINVANANIFPFLLPDEGSHFNYHLKELVKNTKNEIVIVTSSMNYPSLSKNIIRALSHGVHLKIIVTKPSEDPLHLIAYQGVSLYSYSSRPISDTLILVDDSHVCHVSGELNEKTLSGTVSNVWCSDESKLIIQTQKNIHKLLQRCTPYLK